jgi:Mg/Co/Ni transporter MgtE
MNLQEYILNEVRELSLNHSVKSAQKIFKSCPFTHIPIVENGRLVGCLSQSDIMSIEDDKDPISEHSHLMDFFSVPEKITVLELITAFADNDCNLMPVLSPNKEYLGYFELSDIIDVFSNSPFLHSNGVEIVVEKSEKEYAASEVTQIVESNNGKVMGLYISSQTSDITQATVKVVSEDINEIIQTFRRYDYNVISQYEDDFYLQDLKDRSEYLQKYLDM